MGNSGKENSAKMKKHLSTILLFLILLAGLSLLIYPTFSNWWNQSRATSVIANYNAVITEADSSYLDAIWEAADAYNQAVAANNRFSIPEELREQYLSTMDASGIGIIGYVEIPMQNISLPIYHGTEETVLQIGIGHLEWSSLPTGKPGTHVVISGHRGLPSARLFTDIDQMTVGDLFRLEILDQEFTYEVDKISIVLPQEMDDLRIVPGEEYCTLVTCTPYGVNTHRLLVRGHRVEVENKTVLRVPADAVQIRPIAVAPFVAAPILLILLMLLLFAPGKGSAAKNDDE